MKLVRVLVTLLLLILVAYMAGLFDAEKRQHLWQMLANPDWFWLVVCILVGVLVNLSSAIKWWMLARAANLVISLPRTFVYYLIGMFYNLVLPTSVGGDVVRAFEMGRYTGDKAVAMASVFVERFSGIVVLLLLSLVAVLINANTFNLPIITYSLGAFAIALALIGWLAFDRWTLNKVTSLVAGWHPFIARFLQKIERIQIAIEDYKKRPGALLWALINSLVFYALAVLNVYVTARVFSVDVSWATIVLATPVIMLMMNIPLSIGNHGIMEFAYTITFELLGLGSVLGLSTALLMRLKSILDGGAGAVLHPYFATFSKDQLQS